MKKKFKLLIFLLLIFISGCTTLKPPINPINNKINIQGKEVSTFCNIDSDCQITSYAVNFICCGFAGCGNINYSTKEWVAVNKDSFKTLKENICNQREGCVVPECAALGYEIFFTTKCINNICQKVPK